MVGFIVVKVGEVRHRASLFFVNPIPYLRKMEAEIKALRDALKEFAGYAGKSCNMPPAGREKMEAVKQAYLALHAANGWTGSAHGWKVCAAGAVYKQAYRFLQQQAAAHDLSDLL